MGLKQWEELCTSNLQKNFLKSAIYMCAEALKGGTLEVERDMQSKTFDIQAEGNILFGNFSCE